MADPFDRLLRELVPDPVARALVQIEADTTYVVSYHAPNGNYSYEVAGFASDIASNPLRALSSASSSGSASDARTPAAQSR